jgi:hypothetical protein
MIDARTLAEMRRDIEAKNRLQEQLLVEVFQDDLRLARLEQEHREQEADERERRRLERIAGVPLVEVR